MKPTLQMVPVSKEYDPNDSMDTMVFIVNNRQRQNAERKAKEIERKRCRHRRIARCTANMVINIIIAVTSLLGTATIIAYLMLCMR